MYQALYRKYRPQNFDEVSGQEQVTVTLKNEISSGRTGHAYLFTGSRGTGKTSCSKIVAKAVNCPNQQGGNPCGVCDICRGIDDGSILDVVEIDAASNNGVDDIRQLREEANFTPSVTKYRVYIIDETHMLSPAAFNALLKIMEEPPEHVIFILATTEVHKVPATILSRCQRFDFKRIKPEDIVGRLNHVCALEGITLDEEAAYLIGRLCEGAMRDALSLLDVCRSMAEHITAQVVTQAAGLAMQDCLFQVADAVLARDIPTVLQVVETMHQASIDFEKMCVQLIAHYRSLMLVKALPKPEDVALNLIGDLQKLREQAGRYSMQQILYCLTVAQDTLSRMNKTPETRAELEMAIIRMSSPEMDRTMEAVEARLDKLEKAIANLKGMAVAQQSMTAKEPVPIAHHGPQPQQPIQTEMPKQEFVKDPQPQQAEVTRFEPWPKVLEELKHTNKALNGALVEAAAYLYGDVVLIDCDNPFFLEMIRNNEYTKRSIHQAFLAAAGRDYRIGPYRQGLYKTVEAEKTDPMEEMLNQALQEGIDIKIKE